MNIYYSHQELLILNEEASKEIHFTSNLDDYCDIGVLKFHIKQFNLSGKWYCSSTSINSSRYYKDLSTIFLVDDGSFLKLTSFICFTFSRDDLIFFKMNKYEV